MTDTMKRPPLAALVGPPPSRGAPPRFRSDIQGLRAVAVGLVVAFHLWPGQVPGGFVGVDVFFVISGYLITAHLIREVSETGTLRLRRFWARRVRRLLPASLLVLATTLIATVLLLPATVWALTVRQVGASALYVQNWALASDAVDYLARDNDPTPVQHYWSLSVEEQFYLVWPLLLLVAVAVAHRRGSRARRAATAATAAPALIGGLIGLLTALSLCWSVYLTAHDPARAYFVTPTRVWEFGAGALLGALELRWAASRRWAAASGWTGIAAIVAAAFVISETTPFPGWIALLPVLGTVAALAAGGGSSTPVPSRMLGAMPLVFVGNISYAVYLWHWPPIIIVPSVTGHPLQPMEKIAIIAATLGLAWLSTNLFEQPLRNSAWLRGSLVRTFAAAALCMMLIVVGCFAVNGQLRHRIEASAQATARHVASGCYGPEALSRPACDPPMGKGPVSPVPEMVVQENFHPFRWGCTAPMGVETVRSCALGSSSPHPDRTLAIVGDSHAVHWFSAVDALGRARNWRILTFTKSSCPASAQPRVVKPAISDDEQNRCQRWTTEMRRAISDNPDITAVLVSTRSDTYGWASKDDGVNGYLDVWQDWVAQGKQVYDIKTVPRPKRLSTPTCVAVHSNDLLSCAVDRSKALHYDTGAKAVEAAQSPAIKLLDLGDSFCDATLCYPVIGNMIVYRDASHLSDEFSLALAPALGRAIDAAGGVPAH